VYARLLVMPNNVGRFMKNSCFFLLVLSSLDKRNIKQEDNLKKYIEVA